MGHAGYTSEPMEAFSLRTLTIIHSSYIYIYAMGRPTLYSGPPGKLPVLQMASPPLRAGLKGTELNTQPIFIKGKSHESLILINHLPKQFYSEKIFAKEDILKIVGNQTVSGPQ